MIRTVFTGLLAAAITGPAFAQAGNETGYDPNRSCRTYVMQHLPVPVRCMVELLGNWSPKPYIDGDFMFRSPADWLKWKDREDYRHWQRGDFAFPRNGTAPKVAAPSAPVPPLPPAPTLPAAGEQPAAALLCPAEIPAQIVPAPVQGWSGKGGNVMLRLAPQPRVENSSLLCFYGSEREQITLTRPVWGRCVVRGDSTGFDCTP